MNYRKCTNVIVLDGCHHQDHIYTYDYKDFRNLCKTSGYYESTGENENFEFYKYTTNYMEPLQTVIFFDENGAVNFVVHCIKDQETAFPFLMK